MHVPFLLLMVTLESSCMFYLVPRSSRFFSCVDCRRCASWIGIELVMRNGLTDLKVRAEFKLP